MVRKNDEGKNQPNESPRGRDFQRSHQKNPHLVRGARREDEATVATGDAEANLKKGKN